MKRLKIITILLLFILCSVFVAESQEKRYQAYKLDRDYVIPSESFRYEETLKEFMGLLKEYNYQYPIYVFNTYDYTYYFSTPMGLAHTYIDSVNTAYKKVAKAAGEKWTEVFKKFKGCYHYTQTIIIYYDDMLSFIPEEKDYSSDEKYYVEFREFSLHQHKSKEFAKLVKRFAEIYKKNKALFGFETYWGGLGAEEPVVTMVFRGSSNISYLTKHKETQELLKSDLEELTKMRKELTLTIRKSIVKEGLFRPDLSYIPKK